MGCPIGRILTHWMKQMTLTEQLQTERRSYRMGDLLVNLLPFYDFSAFYKGLPILPASGMCVRDIRDRVVVCINLFPDGKEERKLSGANCPGTFYHQNVDGVWVEGVPPSETHTHRGEKCTLKLREKADWLSSAVGQPDAMVRFLNCFNASWERIERSIFALQAFNYPAKPLTSWSRYFYRAQFKSLPHRPEEGEQAVQFDRRNPRVSAERRRAFEFRSPAHSFGAPSEEMSVSPDGFPFSRREREFTPYRRSRPSGDSGEDVDHKRSRI